MFYNGKTFVVSMLKLQLFPTRVISVIQEILSPLLSTKLHEEY